MAYPQRFPAKTPTEIKYGLFVSSVKGHLVSRYGTATAGQANELIGARRIPDGVEGPDGDRVEWDTETVFALSEAEAARFAREYAGHIADGALKKRTEAEYRSQVAHVKAHAIEAQKRIDDAAKKHAEDEAKRAEQQAKTTITTPPTEHR